MSDKISVIIPVYRTEEYLENCVRSVLAQTYTNIEVILVDDGSDDNSPQICDRLALEDNRIKVIHQQNKGLSGARNSGMAIATGDYVMFLDSDDYIEPDMYSYMMSEKGDSEIVVCGVTAIVGDKKEKLPNFEKKTVMSGDEAVRELFKDVKLKNYVGNKVFLFSLFDGIEFPEGVYFEDILTMYKPFMKAESVTLLPESKFSYLRREGSISKTLNIKNVYHRFRAHKIRYEAVKDIYPDAADELLRQMFYSARAVAFVILSGNSFEENKSIVEELSSFYTANKEVIAASGLLNGFEKSQALCLASGKREQYRKMKATDFFRKVNKFMKG